MTSWLVAEVQAGAVRLLIPSPPPASALWPRLHEERERLTLNHWGSWSMSPRISSNSMIPGRIWFYFGKGTGYQKNSDRVNPFLLENSSWTSVYSNCYRRNRGLVLKVADKQINNELLLCNLDFLSWFWVQNGVVLVIFSSNLDICHLMNLIFMKQGAGILVT